MNTREKFLKTMRFEEKGCVPFVEIGAWAQAFERWEKEGMPADENTNFNILKGASYFGLEHTDEIRVNTLACPGFQHEILEEDDRTETFQDQYGCIHKALKTGRAKKGPTRASMDQYLKFGIESRDDFEKVKEHWNPEDPRRFPSDWEEKKKEYATRDYPLCLTQGGQFGLYSILRRYMGTENACTVFFEDTQLASDMLDFFTDCFIRVTDKVLDQVDVDWWIAFEDFAFKTGPLVSVNIFRDFLLPRYQRINEHLRSRGLDIIAIDSDGNIEVLLDLLRDAGFNCLLPMEVAAGMDVVSVRERYGDAFSILGGIDKRPLAKGRDAIERELAARIPPMLETGGYIPTIDHTIPHDVSYENFLFYLDTKKKMLEA